MADSFLRCPDISATMPCIAKPGTIRFIAMVDRDISPAFPYLNAVIDGAIYNHHGHTLTFLRGENRISLFPSKITGTKLDDRAAAHEALAWTVNMLNDCWQRKDEIEPNYERRQQLGALDIYKLLPGTNCRQCGQMTCLAFATRLSQQQDNISKCRELLQAEYQTNRSLVGELLKSAGYDVPAHIF